MIHPDLPYRHFVATRGLQNRSRQAHMIVEIAFCFRDLETASEHRCRKVFGARLAIASCNGNDL